MDNYINLYLFLRHGYTTDLSEEKELAIPLYRRCQNSFIYLKECFHNLLYWLTLATLNHAIFLVMTVNMVILGFLHKISGATIVNSITYCLITYVSGMCTASQTWYLTLIKEADTIYWCVKRMAMYLQDAKLIIWSHHKLFEKLLFSITKKTKGDNWTFELSDYDIHFEYIPGSQNILVDFMSCILHLGLTVKSPL